MRGGSTFLKIILPGSGAENMFYTQPLKKKTGERMGCVGVGHCNVGKVSKGPQTETSKKKKTGERIWRVDVGHCNVGQVSKGSRPCFCDRLFLIFLKKIASMHTKKTAFRIVSASTYVHQKKKQPSASFLRS